MKVLALVVALTLVLSAMAFGINENGKVAIHVDAHLSRTCAKNFPVITGCADIVTTLASPDADCFPVFFDLDEYQGFDYGMTWPGMYTCAFTSCSDLTIGGVVNPGDPVSHAWTACQYANICITGWGWIWDYGMVEIVPHTGPNKVYIGDCAGGLLEPMCAFKAGIGGSFGDDPCLPTGIEPSTWGSIKSMFK